jgi:hypothetical protein
VALIHVADAPRVLRRFSERHRLRAAADAWIERRGDDRPASYYAWRIDELTSRKERRRLADSVREVLEALSPKRLPGASPLNRVALRPHGGELAAIAARLDDLERPVSASGVLAVRRLLTAPDSVLYARPQRGDAPRDPGRVLRIVRQRLEVRG